jgi:flagella basal body P-ring formation protein FlgA
MVRKAFFFIALAIGLIASAYGESLEDFLVGKVIADYGLDTSYTEIRLHRSSVAMDDFSDCTIDAYPLTGQEPKGIFPMKVDVYRDGEIVARGQAALEIRCFADLLVPRHKIERHTLLAPELFEPKRCDVTSLSVDMIADPEMLRGYRTKSNLYPGRMVPFSKIEPIPAVELGKPVTIKVGAGRLEVRADGVALENGAVGEMIRVKNTGSNKILTAKVIDEAVVEVSL